MHAVQQKANRPNSGKKEIAPVTQKMGRQNSSHANNANNIQHQKNQDDANDSNSVKQLMAIQDQADQSAIVTRNILVDEGIQRSMSMHQGLASIANDENDALDNGTEITNEDATAAEPESQVFQVGEEIHQENEGVLSEEDQAIPSEEDQAIPSEEIHQENEGVLSEEDQAIPSEEDQTLLSEEIHQENEGVLSEEDQAIPSEEDQTLLSEENQEIPGETTTNEQQVNTEVSPTSEAANARKKSLKQSMKNGFSAIKRGFKPVKTGLDMVESVYSDGKDIKEQQEIKGAEIAKKTKIVMDEKIVKENANKAKSALSKIMSLDFSGFQNINLLSESFNILEMLDIFGITNILASIGNFRVAKKEKHKMQVIGDQLEIAKRVPAFPEELTQIVKYAFGKISRSFYTAISNGVLEAIQAVTRIVTIATGGISGIFTESINLAAKVAQKAEKAYRMVKGVFKHFKGTRGVARNLNAEKVFNMCCDQDLHAVNFMKDFFEKGFSKFLDKAHTYITSEDGVDEESKNKLIEYWINKSASRDNMAECFKLLKNNEDKNKVKKVKEMLIAQIADEFKSNPPSWKYALVKAVISEEAVQEGLKESLDAATKQ